MDQLPERVRDSVLGNVGTIVSFRTSPQDAERLAPLFSPQVTATDILGMPDHRAIVRGTGHLGETPFTIQPDAPEPIVKQ